MWEVGRVMCLGVLAGLAVTDICWRRIPAEIFVMGTIGILVYQACSRETDPILLLGGAGVGLYGDCWGILVLGLYLGLWKLLEVLAGAFLLLLGAVMVLLVKRRMRSKCTLPFFPFLTGGYLMGMMMGGTLW